MAESDAGEELTLLRTAQGQPPLVAATGRDRGIGPFTRLVLRGATVIDGGIHNTGAITGESYQADATAMRFLAGASTPTIVNDGSISASSTQINSATTGVLPVTVDAIHIHKGATVTSIVNGSGILAELTGTGGVGGTVSAIVDKSGTLANITNTGTITAEATQTLVSVPMPATVTAIDISHSDVAQTIRIGDADVEPRHVGGGGVELDVRAD